MIRRLLPVLLVALLGTAGCGTDPPQVTFTAGQASAQARPAQFCADMDLSECVGDPTAPVELPVPPGTPLQITVPPEIAETPWQVVYTFRDASGAQLDERSAVFAPDERSLYTVELPAPTDRLLQAQVQQYGPPPEVNPETGEVEFPTGASWVLTASA